MGNTSLGKYTSSFAVSLAITSLVSAILVVIKESSGGLMAFMKAVTSHHWMTHTLFALIVFFLLGWALGRVNQGQGPRMAVNGLLTLIVVAIVVSGLIIAGFYLIEG